MLNQKPYRRPDPTKDIPSHQGPIPQAPDKPIRVLPPEEVVAANPRPLTDKVVLLKKHLEEHGPQTFKAVERTIGITSSNLLRMVQPYPETFKVEVVEKMHNFGRNRVLALVGQEIDRAAVMEKPTQTLRFGKWSDGGLTLSNGLKEMHLSADDVATLKEFLG